MKTVYICSPLKGDIEGNIEKARRYTKFALLCGVAPVTPHFFALCIDDTNPGDRRIGMNAGQTLMGMCDEIWVFGTIRSEGMLKEIDLANRRLKIPILYISDDYVETYIKNRNGGGGNGA